MSSFVLPRKFRASAQLTYQYSVHEMEQGIRPPRHTVEQPAVHMLPAAYRMNMTLCDP